MDVTAFSVLVFALLKVGLWLGVVALAYHFGNQIRLQLQPVPAEEGEGAMAPEASEVLWLNRYKIGGWLMVFFAAIYFTQIEAAYRPKTVVQPDNPILEQQLREIDRATAPVIQPAQGDLRDAANANYADENAADNVAARERFLELPDDKE